MALCCSPRSALRINSLINLMLRAELTLVPTRFALLLLLEPGWFINGLRLLRRLPSLSAQATLGVTPTQRPLSTWPLLTYRPSTLLLPRVTMRLPSFPHRFSPRRQLSLRTCRSLAEPAPSTPPPLTSMAIRPIARCLLCLQPLLQLPSQTTCSRPISRELHHHWPSPPQPPTQSPQPLSWST
jgi:hypothetical protein